MALFEAELFQTRLMEARGKQILRLVRQKKRFGIVGGTGSGKTASIEKIIREEFGDDRDLVVSIVNREYEATEETWQSNVFVITPGIAMIWAKNGIITKDDLTIFDEVHQTSDHLELSEALSLFAECRIIWMSATVDPKVFATYLKSDKVVTFDQVDKSKKAKVRLIKPEKEKISLYGLLQRVVREKRGMVMFLPTRREVEEYAKETERLFFGRLQVEFYHGGEPSAKLRPFLNKGVANNNRPFVIFMTNAGQSGLNIEGLNTVVIRDECITEEMHSGVLVRIKAPLLVNDILQMAGRVNGRVEDGEICIITERNINFHKLKPKKVKFVLGHNLEGLAMICGKLGVSPSQLRLPVLVDKRIYEIVAKRLIKRGILEPGGTNLTPYGKRVERIPSSVPLAEMVTNSPSEILNVVIISLSSSGLYRLVKSECDISEFVVSGSDHLTTYNIVAYAITNFAEIDDWKGYTEYYFREKEFYSWAEEKGVNAKEIEEIALALKSILHNLEIPLTEKLPQADKKMKSLFIKLLSEVLSLDVVRRQRDSYGNEVWTERHSSCDIVDYYDNKEIIGKISIWKDNGGIIRRAIEGTLVPVKRKL